MDGNQFLYASLVALAIQSPVILVSLVAMLLSLIFARRCTASAACVFLGGLLVLLVKIGVTLTHNAVALSLYPSSDWEPEQVGYVLGGIAVVGNLAMAAGIGLVVIAAFLGRRASPEVDAD